MRMSHRSWKCVSFPSCAVYAGSEGYLTLGYPTCSRGTSLSCERNMKQVRLFSRQRVTCDMLKGVHRTESPQRSELLSVLHEEHSDEPQGIDQDVLEACMRSWHNQHPLASHEKVVWSGESMTARGGVNGEAGRVKDLAVASMQGSPTVLFRIGPVMIHCGVGVGEWEARYDHAVCLSEA